MSVDAGVEAYLNTVKPRVTIAPVHMVMLPRHGVATACDAVLSFESQLPNRRL